MIILTSIRTATIIIITIVTIITVRWCVSLGPLGSRCQDGIDHASLLEEKPMREMGMGARRGWEADVMNEGERKGRKFE